MPEDERSTQTEKRRGVRFPVVVPVEAKWQEASGKNIKEVANAIEVNAQGGLLEMKVYPSVGSHLDLTNLLSGESFRARVVGTRRSTEGRVLGVAVELLIPSETFWGVNFRLKKTSAELVRLNRAMQSGNLDPRILREFRDAVDYVRKTAWAAEEWQERQLRQRDPHTILALITSERIRRATQLSNAISADLAAQEVTSETSGLEEFFQAVDGVHQRLADLFKNRKP
ncbi:MAG: hypothetical protein DMG45_10835 [Acidobacteria bacterium]|jgi:hypothetical protein|nr:MAG: hypothetical protein DMG45_10835 [Acidobacteriota bacterium]PYU59688.1 MAG: hypothetical protein DMG55_13155 [Acidobacteriota bacterium]